MDLVEEQGVIVSVQGSEVSIAPLAESGCNACLSNGVCGTALLSTMFGKKQRLLVAENTIDAKPGEQVIIGLNRTALVLVSLMVYLLPLLMLILGAIAGDAVGHRAGLEDAEVISILSGIGAASLTFIFVSRVVRSVFFSAFFYPVLLHRQ